MPVALVTAANSRELDEDLAPVELALGGLGIGCEVIVWDDASVDWSAFDVAVVRSTWDYPDRRDEFVAWAERVAAQTMLLNPPAVLRWNTDKRYLADLAARGVPVVPTQFVAPGEAFQPPHDRDIVVKPAVSAGARDAARYAAGDIDGIATHVLRLHAQGRVAMVQPYVTAIDDAGEVAVVFVDGEPSHGLHKAPILAMPVHMAGDGVFAVEAIEPREPTAAEIAVGRAALVATTAILQLDRSLLYARVDLVPSDTGEPLLLELELTEPSLFHAHAPRSAQTFAEAIAGRAKTLRV